MNRRDLIALLGSTVAAWPLAAWAQHPGMSRVGLLHSTSSQFIAAFRQGLREAGFVEGQNVLFEARLARGDYERLPALAAELVDLRVDLLAAFGTPAVRAARTASIIKSVSAYLISTREQRHIVALI